MRSVSPPLEGERAERAAWADTTHIGLFLDYENLAIGAREGSGEPFDVRVVLERLLDKGKLIVRRAYADWARYRRDKHALHAAAVELIDVPQRSQGGKNSADIRLVVDALDLSHLKPHVDTFVIGSGDSDFSPLVAKLRENGRTVVGVGLRGSTSDLLVETCDEFLFYEDIVRDQADTASLADVDEARRPVYSLLVDSIKALRRENQPVLWASLIKQTMLRKRPSFSEGSYGYSSFSDLLREASELGLVDLTYQRDRRTYVVDGLHMAAA